MNKKMLLKVSFFVTPLLVSPLSVVLSCSSNSSSEEVVITGEQTVAKTNLDAKTLGLSGTVTDAITIISKQWILEHKNALLSGSTDLFKSNNDVVENSIKINHKSEKENTIALFSFALKAGKSFNQDQKPTTEITNFEFEISGFEAPKNLDLENAKEKLIYFLNELKYDFARKKASTYATSTTENQLQNFEALGVKNLFGFKVKITLDTSKNNSGYNDETGQLFLKINLKRDANEESTFNYILGGFLTNAQEKAEKDDENFKAETIFNDSFSYVNPTNVVKVKTKKADVNLATIKSEEELLKIISINPENGNENGKDDEETSSILKKELPDGYELKFIDGSIKQVKYWSGPINEIEAGIQIVNKTNNQSSGIYKLLVRGFKKIEENESNLNQWVKAFEDVGNPIKASENQYNEKLASTIQTAEQLEEVLYTNDDVNNIDNEIKENNVKFVLDETFQPSDQDDKKGSLKARFTFSWKNQPNVKVTKEITIYGFKLSSSSN